MSGGREDHTEIGRGPKGTWGDWEGEEGVGWSKGSAIASRRESTRAPAPLELA
jgi:hypothetical protein